ncbi:DUF3857 domain-containing protein [Flavobacterium dankookense]|uniref:Uncharacterized protein DUF3858 n=1 Tax=Flavobacterium dankookense TaxID=706186 RepID=A0A4R6QDJ2_9FLAO|nr:DUF3857 domain-containing protein [Flavobacterium dankookense]TDP60257.1 uncharacterized protein DUF3858 [Flavobacterium dankookense]
MTLLNKLKIFVFLLTCFVGIGQNTKPKSYIISKTDNYIVDLKSEKLVITLFSEERKWVGDKDNIFIKQNRIDYTSSFEEISDIEAYSISPENKKEKVKYIGTEDRQIDEIFYHDMKFKYYSFPNLKEGSQTYSSYRKTFKVPQLLDTYYFKDNLDCKDSKVTLKVSNKVEIGYILQGDDTDFIQFSSIKEGDYTIYTWQLLNSTKVDYFEDAPNPSYFLPHLIFYIKNYTTSLGKEEVLGSIDNLYKYYYQTVKDINKTDQTALKKETESLIKGLTSSSEKVKAIFDFVQTKIHYVAFEDGMGGFVPREAADVFQKKYGDCKDMANLLNEMLHYANIESYIAWIGTRHNNYTYEAVPTPIVDNHMIAVAKVDEKYIFLDATGQFTTFPSFTPFIQGKQALLKIDANNYKIISVPITLPEDNQHSGLIQYRIENNKLIGEAEFKLKGYNKTHFLSTYKSALHKDEVLKEYLSRFIENLTTSNIKIKNDDLSQNPLEIKHNFELEKWTKQIDNQIIFKPILFFPFSNERIDEEKRKVPLEFDFKKSYNFEYEITLPNDYKTEFLPENYVFSNELLDVNVNYTLKNNKIIVSQKLMLNKLLLEKNNFANWNAAIKSMTKQYNQNIILTKI